jgi:hypothetical protein
MPPKRRSRIETGREDLAFAAAQGIGGTEVH